MTEGYIIGLTKDEGKILYDFLDKAKQQDDVTNNDDNNNKLLVTLMDIQEQIDLQRETVERYG